METIHRGLNGVNVDTSRICSIDGENGRLIYRGYDITELADKASFEEVVHLLWLGDLPTRSQLDGLQGTVRSAFALPAEVLAMLASLPKGTNPMHALRTGVSMLAAFDPDPDDVGEANVRRIGLSLLGQVTALVAAHQRIQAGHEPVAPDPELGVAANLLRMVNGENPTDAAVRVMDVALVLHAEHGSNASTFVGRSTASTLTDAYSAITAAIGSLKGPLHGGANAGVMKALEEIGSVGAVEPYVLDTLASEKGRVMGFGHRVYQVMDPRAIILKGVSEKLAEESGDSKWFEMSLEMERVMKREMDARGKQVAPNVDFFSASVYRMLGFEKETYTPIFAVSRVAGWMAHLFEQYNDNRLMRPRLVYEGETGKTFVPIEQRG
ncbi:MAG: citrate/2-methylcitrate synthase [Trueperaceae bacterium]